MSCATWSRDGLCWRSGLDISAFGFPALTEVGAARHHSISDLASGTQCRTGASSTGSATFLGDRRQISRRQGNDPAPWSSRLQAPEHVPLDSCREREKLGPILQRIAIEDRVGFDATEASRVKKSPHAGGREKLQVFDVEDGRLASQELRGGCTPVMTDQEQGSSRLEGSIGVAAERQRIRKVLDGLKAGDQAERIWLERTRSKDVLMDQLTDRGIGLLNRGGRGFDPGHILEAGGQQLLKKRAISRADVHCAIPVREPGDNAWQEPAVGPSRVMCLHAAIKLGLLVEGR